MTRAARGLTLVEFLIATGIAAFALLGVASMFPAALRTVIAGGETTKATMLAQAMMDVVRSEPFDLIDARYHNLDTRTVGVTCPLAEAGAPPSEDSAARRWTCDLRMSGARDTGQGLPDAFGRVQVECVDLGGATAVCPTGLRRVTVGVSWGEGGSRSVSVVSYVARVR
jgi:Tfp pilus assembly protein PilV